MAPKQDAKPDSKGKGDKGPRAKSPDPETLDDIGKFYYPNGAIYEGEWTIELEPEGGSGKAKPGSAGKKDAPREKDKQNAAKEKEKAARDKGGKGIKDDGKDAKKAGRKSKDLSVPTSPELEEEIIIPPEVLKGNRYRHGQGTYIDPDYSYTGSWKNDMMHGVGTFKYASGALYEGEWTANTYNGQGTYKWIDGRSYNGEWNDNKMHGEGVYIDAGGHIWRGKFCDGYGPGLVCDV